MFDGQIVSSAVLGTAQTGQETTNLEAGLMAHGPSEIPPLSLVDAYEKIYRWYRGNTELARYLAGSGYSWDERRKMILAVMNSKSIDEARDILKNEFWEEQLSAANVIALIDAFPIPSIATDVEILFVCREVLCGALEWGYHGSDGVMKMHEYVKSSSSSNDGLDLVVGGEQEFDSRVQQVNPILWGARELCRSHNCVFANSDEAMRKVFEFHEKRSNGI